MLQRFLSVLIVCFVVLTVNAAFAEPNQATEQPRIHGYTLGEFTLNGKNIAEGESEELDQFRHDVAAALRAASSNNYSGTIDVQAGTYVAQQWDGRYTHRAWASTAYADDHGTIYYHGQGTVSEIFVPHDATDSEVTRTAKERIAIFDAVMRSILISERESAEIKAEWRDDGLRFTTTMVVPVWKDGVMERRVFTALVTVQARIQNTQIRTDSRIFWEIEDVQPWIPSRVGVDGGSFGLENGDQILFISVKDRNSFLQAAAWAEAFDLMSDNTREYGKEE